MKAMKNRNYVSSLTTCALGVALLSLAACSAGESTTGTPAPGGSAGFTGPLAFVNNTTDKTLTTVGLKGDSGNVVVNTIDAGEFENAALGDMQFSNGNWIFVNLEFANKVAAIQPVAAATPVHEVNLPTGTRPVHMYRDRNDGEVIWIMNDGDNSQDPATAGDDLVNCRAQGGGSVTVVHNSHVGVGGQLPEVKGTTCLLADGHKVATFAENKRVFVSSETAGEIAVLDGDETSTNFRKMIARIDLCDSGKESSPCNSESNTPLTTPFTPNGSGPHGIRWSALTKKIYSIQEGYHEIAEIDPNPPYNITKRWDLSSTPYTGYGISPDGRYLLLRGETKAPQSQAIKLGVIDLNATSPIIANLNTPELNGASNGSFATGSSAFKFSPDGKRLYFLVGNSNDAIVTKEDWLFAYDTSTLSATTPALTLFPDGEIQLLQTGRHSLDVLAQGAKEAKYIVVSNRGVPGTVSIISGTDHAIKDTVNVGKSPGGVLVFEAGAGEAGNQASN